MNNLPEDLEMAAFDALDLESSAQRHARLAELVAAHPEHAAALQEIVGADEEPAAASLDSPPQTEATSRRRRHRRHPAWLLLGVAVLATGSILAALPFIQVGFCVNPETWTPPAAVTDLGTFRRAQASLRGQISRLDDGSPERDRIEAQWVWLRAMRAVYVDHYEATHREQVSVGDPPQKPLQISASQVRRRLSKMTLSGTLPLHTSFFERSADQPVAELRKRLQHALSKCPKGENSPWRGLRERLSRTLLNLDVGKFRHADHELETGWSSVLRDFGGS